MGRRAVGFQAHAGVPPHLAIIRAEQDPAADSYLRQIRRAFGGRGLTTSTRPLGDDTDERELAELLAELASDESIHGILVQLPLPGSLTFETVARHLPPEKDVDGAHPVHAGILAQGRPGLAPSAPRAGLEMLRAARVPLAGKTAVVVGRSPIVGRPMAQLLLQEDATVVICHSRTPDLAAFTRQADVLVAAAGRPGLIDASGVKPGVVVVDFGINLVEGRLVGDVDFDSVSAVAGAITPVPGGTGPVTTAVLARNVLDNAERLSGIR